MKVEQENKMRRLASLTALGGSPGVNAVAVTADQASTDAPREDTRPVAKTRPPSAKLERTLSFQTPPGLLVSEAAVVEARRARWNKVYRFFSTRPGSGAEIERLFMELDTDGSGDVDIK